MAFLCRILQLSLQSLRSSVELSFIQYDFFFCFKTPIPSFHHATTLLHKHGVQGHLQPLLFPHTQAVLTVFCAMLLRSAPCPFMSSDSLCLSTTSLFLALVILTRFSDLFFTLTTAGIYKKSTNIIYIVLLYFYIHVFLKLVKSTKTSGIVRLLNSA